jgi:hypothetical protein
MTKNMKMMEIEVARIVVDVNANLRKSLIEDEKRYHTHTCDCGRAWALQKPRIIITPNVRPRPLVVPARKNGMLLYDKEGKIVTKKIHRKQTECFCGKPFMLGLKPYPTIHIDDLRGDAKQPTQWGPRVLRALEALAVKRKATNGKTE